jgi:hypothetical protein
MGEVLADYAFTNGRIDAHDREMFLSLLGDVTQLSMFGDWLRDRQDEALSQVDAADVGGLTGDAVRKTMERTEKGEERQWQTGLPMRRDRRRSCAPRAPA